MKFDLCELQVLVHGKPVREYPHDDGRLYIEGRKNTDFILRLKNLTHQRILAVISIDGLSIITGKEARVDGSGYVIGPRQSFSIPGWSLNDSEVARFFFHKAAESYAGQSGKPRNIGVIGCAVFREKKPVLRSSTVLLGADPVCDAYSSPITEVFNASYDSSAVTFHPDSAHVDSTTRYRVDVAETERPRSAEIERGPSPRRKKSSHERMTLSSGLQASLGKKRAIAESAPSEIGTGFGQRQGFHVREISFERESSTPNEVLEITYDTRKGLEKRGVDLDWRPTVGRPDPFPGDKHCKPPAGWNG